MLTFAEGYLVWLDIFWLLEEEFEWEERSGFPVKLGGRW